MTAVRRGGIETLMGKPFLERMKRSRAVFTRVAHHPYEPETSASGGAERCLADAFCVGGVCNAIGTRASERQRLQFYPNRRSEIRSKREAVVESLSLVDLVVIRPDVLFHVLRDALV